MAITTQFSNPIDLLKLILTYQSWGDNAQGFASSAARITIGEGFEGSFDSATLDPVRNIKIAYQISDIESGNTQDLISKICKQFNLIQYTNGYGFECVKYLFSETSDTTIQSFILDDTTEFSQISYPEESSICINPVIKYGYDFALDGYKKQLQINNVQMPSYNSSYSTGFDNNDGLDYWNICRNKLYPLVKHQEEMDSGLSENDLITDYQGALFRLVNVIRLMSSCKFSFTVPFTKGLNLKAGDLISINFNHLSLSGNVDYLAVVNSVSLSKSTNSCQLNVMFLQDLDQTLLGALQNTTNGSNVSYQDTTDGSNLNINTSYEFDGLANLTYVDPLGTLCHITQINDDLSVLQNEIDECQFAIVTDITSKPVIYTDDLNNIKWFATGNGTSGFLPKYLNEYGTLVNSSIFDNGIYVSTSALQLTSLTANRVLISNSNNILSASNVTTTELGFLSGKNSVIDGSGTNNYIPIFTGTNRLANSIMTGSAAGIEINSVDTNYNGGLRIVADSLHHGVLALGCAGGGSGTQVGQWSILRYPSSLGYGLGFRYNNTDMTILDTNGTYNTITLNASPAFIANNNDINGTISFGGWNVENNYNVRPSIQAGAYGILELDSKVNWSVHLNWHSNGNVLSCNGGGNFGVDVITPLDKLHVGGNIRASGYIRPGSFTVGQTNTGDAWIGRSTDEGAGSLTLQLGGADENTNFRVVDRAWTKTIFKLFTNGCLELNTVDNSYNGGLRVVSDSNHYCGVMLGCAGGGSGTQVGQWNIFRTSLSTGYTLDFTYNAFDNVRARFTTVGDLYLGYSDVVGATSSPRNINLGLTYSDGATMDKCKLFLYKGTGGDHYGFSVGSNGDLQYHSGSLNSRHDFYNGNILNVRHSNTGHNFYVSGVNILNLDSMLAAYVRQTISHSPADTQYNTSNLELISNYGAYPTRMPSIGFHRAGIDAMTLFYAGGRTLQVRDNGNAAADTILTTGNLVGLQSAHYHNALHAEGYEGTYYIRANWTPINGDYKWRLTSNYADPEVSVGHSDFATDSHTVDGLHAYMFFNNMGGLHGDNTDFNTINKSGAYYVTGATNGPGISNVSQYYGFTLGLGSNYEGSYHCQLYWPRNPIGQAPYLCMRQMDGSVWGSWQKMFAGYADSAGSATNATNATNASNADTVDGYHASFFQPLLTGLSANIIPMSNGGSSLVNSNVYSFGGTTFIDPSSLSSSNYNDGLRIGRSTAGYSLIALGCVGWTGTRAGQWTWYTSPASDNYTLYWNYNGVNQMTLSNGGDLWIKTNGGDGINFSGSQGYRNIISSTTNSTSQLHLQSTGASIALMDYPLIIMSTDVYMYSNLSIGGKSIIPIMSNGDADGNFRFIQLGTQYCLQRKDYGTWTTVSILG